MSDYSLPLGLPTQKRGDEERALGNCRCCLRTLPLAFLDENSECKSRFACWIAENDLAEYLDNPGR